MQFLYSSQFLLLYPYFNVPVYFIFLKVMRCMSLLKRTVSFQSSSEVDPLEVRVQKLLFSKSSYIEISKFIFKSCFK